MTDYALDELMVVEASRHIDDGNVVMVGTGLPMVASLFALKSRAPNMCYVVETGPVGGHCVSVCTNISCMLRGADEIVAHLEDKLRIRLGESTPDGKFYLKREEECLAACCGAPMMMVDHAYHENLTPAKAGQILEELA